MHIYIITLNGIINIGNVYSTILIINFQNFNIYIYKTYNLLLNHCD